MLPLSLLCILRYGRLSCWEGIDGLDMRGIESISMEPSSLFGLSWHVLESSFPQPLILPQIELWEGTIRTKGKDGPMILLLQS